MESRPPMFVSYVLRPFCPSAKVGWSCVNPFAAGREQARTLLLPSFSFNKYDFLRVFGLFYKLFNYINLVWSIFWSYDPAMTKEEEQVVYRATTEKGDLDVSFFL